MITLHADIMDERYERGTRVWFWCWESWIGVTDLLEYTYICFMIISNYHRILN